MKVLIEYKSVLAPFKNIKERNYAFNNLDAQSQRLEIAWDALQLVLQQEVISSSGCYWDGTLWEEVNQTENSEELQTLLTSNLPVCSVCQRGLMMLSQIRLGNELDTSVTGLSEGTPDIVKGFDYEDFRKMEDEYEWSTYSLPYSSNTDAKLANICCNVLVNGNFNPEDKTNYLTT